MISMSDREFDQAVRDALQSVPDEFARYLENVAIEVREAPDAAFCRLHDVPNDLLGLFDGVPITESGHDTAPTGPNRIFIFRSNLLELCESRGELLEEIRITVLHEIGHHFGLDEQQLEDLGYD